MRSLAVMALAAFISGPVQAEELAPRRDGAWLQDGIELYQRMSGHTKLPEKQVSQAQGVMSYVCAVVDLERFLVFRAALVNGAVAEAKEEHHMDPTELKGIGEALPLLLPLMGSRFFEDHPSCDRVLLMVRDFCSSTPTSWLGTPARSLKVLCCAPIRIQPSHEHPARVPAHRR
jgi:hypothetical protein